MLVSDWIAIYAAIVGTTGTIGSIIAIIWNIRKSRSKIRISDIWYCTDKLYVKVVNDSVWDVSIEEYEFVYTTLDSHRKSGIGAYSQDINPIIRKRDWDILFVGIEELDYNLKKLEKVKIEISPDRIFKRKISSRINNQVKRKIRRKFTNLIIAQVKQL